MAEPPCGRAGRIAAATASGLLAAMAGSLEPWWWAAWLAPVGLLWAAFAASRREAAWLAVLAALIGSTSTLAYYVPFLGLAGTAIVALLRAALLAATVVLTRAVVLRHRHWLAAFCYPALCAAADTLVAALSPHGSAGSLAYSQMDFLPVLQSAALAGTPGIVFVVNLFGSAVAVALHRGALARPGPAQAVPAAVLALALGYGVVRLAAAPQPATVPVGLAAVAHPFTRAPRLDEAEWERYAALAADLAGQGARLVVLPEKSATLDPPAAERLRARLGRIAAAHRVFLLVAVDLLEEGRRENRAWLFTPEGALADGYLKHHLVPGFEAGFAAGAGYEVRAIGDRRFGIAICKDMDFAALGRRYGRLGVDALLVPASDFDRDAWQHARMAMLRGVENGYGMVRAARHGLLSISDRYGRVVAVRSSVGADAATLAAAAPLGDGRPTPYARWGDWFGWLCVVAAAAAAVTRLGWRPADHRAMPPAGIGDA